MPSARILSTSDADGSQVVGGGTSLYRYYVKQLHIQRPHRKRDISKLICLRTSLFSLPRCLTRAAAEHAGGDTTKAIALRLAFDGDDVESEPAICPRALLLCRSQLPRNRLGAGSSKALQNILSPPTSWCSSDSSVGNC